jgi:dephospho-CoA kinase
MILLGLTGGIGMGKSTAAGILSNLGVPVVDTDLIARQVVEPGQEALTEIEAAFGLEMLCPEGQLNREALARKVFADSDARKRLEAILHPRIRQIWRRQVDEWRRQGRTAGAVVIPLLFETAAETQFDAIICVVCSVGSQLDRLAGRGWSDQDIHRRMEAQMPIEKKVALSTFVVWNEGPLSVHREQLALILRRCGWS